MKSRLRSVRKRVFRSTELVLMAKDLAEIEPVSVPEALSVRAIDEADFPALEDFCRVHRADDPEAPARVRDCRSRGYSGFLATVGGDLLGHFWWVGPEGHRAQPHPRIQALALELKDASAYLFDFYIAPPYRGCRLSLPFLVQIHAGLRQRGCRTAICDVLGDNDRARHAYRAAGWRDVGTVRIRRVLSRVLIGPGGWRWADARWF